MKIAPISYLLKVLFKFIARALLKKHPLHYYAAIDRTLNWNACRFFLQVALYFLFSNVNHLYAAAPARFIRLYRYQSGHILMKIEAATVTATMKLRAPMSSVWVFLISKPDHHLSGSNPIVSVFKCSHTASMLRWAIANSFRHAKSLGEAISENTCMLAYEFCLAFSRTQNRSAVSLYRNRCLHIAKIFR